VVILSLSGKLELLNKMLVEPILKNLPTCPCFFLVVIMDRKAVYLGTLE
jgi:hypothetical protein